MVTSISLIRADTAVSGRLSFGVWTRGVLAAAMLSLGATMLAALEAPSKPFLEKNGFYLRSAGFKVKFANDAAGQKALRALPAHRFVVHKVGGGERYLYADPKTCVCVFVGTRDAYLNYRDILARPLPQADDVAPDYKTQAGALLNADLVDDGAIDDPGSVAEYLQDTF
jgi:hypothetical protein